jgi:H/ACA ribonucleoprotein complex subunit 2
MASDVSPIDVISHIPVFCEEKEVPYIFIPSRSDLGFSCTTKRPTSVVMILPDQKNDADYEKQFEECIKKLKEFESEF